MAEAPVIAIYDYQDVYVGPGLGPRALTQSMASESVRGTLV